MLGFRTWSDQCNSASNPTQPLCDCFYKDDYGLNHQFLFFILLIFNSIFGLIIIRHLYLQYKYNQANTNKNKKAFIMRILLLISILCRIAYEIDIYIDLNVGLYFFFGVTSVLTFLMLMILISKFWIEIMLTYGGFIIGPYKKHFLIYSIIILGFSYLSTLIITLILWSTNDLCTNPLYTKSKEGNIIALLTGIESLFTFILFCWNTIELKVYVSSLFNIHHKTRSGINLLVLASVTIVARLIGDSLRIIDPYFFDSIFIYVYYIFSDIIPTAIFIRVFLLSSLSSARLNQDNNTNNIFVEHSGDKSLSSSMVDSLTIEEGKYVKKVAKNLLSARDLFNNDSSFKLEDLEKSKIIGILFSGAWCPPCREFIPKLIELYKEVNKFDKILEIIYISCDQNNDEFEIYFKKMPWLALPFGHLLCDNMIETYEIDGIPELIILRSDGSLITKTGRSDLEKYKELAITKWIDLI